MSNIRRNEWFPNMNHVFDDFLSKDVWQWGLNNNSSTNTTIPAVNIKETKETFEVEMAAPGMSKKDFKIQLDGNTLTISSEREKESEMIDEAKYIKREFSYEPFYRTFELQKNVVDVESIQEKYENGVLKLVIPKKEEAKQKPPRMIEIK